MRLNSLFGISKLKINHVEHQQETVIILASIISTRSQCPDCGKFSSCIHDYYYRSINDLPVFQNTTIIKLRTRKFRCKNISCHRKVFSEQIPEIYKYARRTARVSKLLDNISIELTGKQGSLLSSILMLKVSISTITRIAHSQQLPEIKQSNVLGVDDWAYRKGVSYGTILIDMETSRPIELLSSREGKDLKKWLMKYPDVKIVTRDRASSYSSAISEVCPNATQVADRFHLLMNLSEALDKYFKSIRKEIKVVIEEKTTEILNATDNTITRNNKIENNSQPPLKPLELVNMKADQRLEKFNKVKELQEQGVSRLRISKNLGISRDTVTSYFRMESLIPKKSSRSTNIELFTSHIVARLNTKGYQIKDIINEITELGFNGRMARAYININAMKEHFDINTPDYRQILKERIPFVKPLHSRKLAKYVGFCLTDIMDPDERNYIRTLIDNIAELKIVRKLVQIFKTMLERRSGNIRRWIEFIKKSKYRLTGLRSFANGLMRNIHAVENGINMDWSNGGVEGHVNRIKTIKRQMYGRASFDLLRKKVILSQTG